MGSRVYVKGKKKYTSVTTVLNTQRRITGKISKRYIAGLFDGEGCIVINERKTAAGFTTHWMETSISNAYLPVLEDVKKKFKGKIREIPGKIGPLYKWDAGAQTSLVFLQSIFPYLRLKKEEAEIAINFQMRMVRRGGCKPTEGEVKTRKSERLMLQELKKRRWYYGK